MISGLTDTICAPATRMGGGAIAIIRVSGPDALRCVDSVVSLRRGSAADAPGYSVRYGTVDGLDEVLVSVFHAPHSYTGEESAEISCHASPYVVSELLSRLCAAGCRMAEPGEFTRRAFLNGKMDLAQAESVADMIAADSKAAHDLAYKQLQGRYSSEFKGIRDQLLKLAALIELELDFSEEEVEFADRSQLAELVADASSRISALKESYRVGNAIKAGVPVAIVGAPNSGKSTLLNALLGEDRAIVSPIAGTTRDTVEETVIMDGVKFRFIDTAGIRETSDPIEKLGVERSLGKLRSAAIVIGLVSCTDEDSTGANAFDGLSAGIDPQSQKFIPVYSKCDIAGAGLEAGAIAISAKTGSGMDILRAAILKCSGIADDYADATVVTSARHFEALSTASEELSSVSSAISLDLPGDLLAEHLRSAISSIGEIVGEISTDQILGEIFSKFCIGK